MLVTKKEDVHTVTSAFELFDFYCDPTRKGKHVNGVKLGSNLLYSTARAKRRGTEGKKTAKKTADHLYRGAGSSEEPAEPQESVTSPFRELAVKCRLLTVNCG